jgi:hypothetical protein
MIPYIGPEMVELLVAKQEPSDIAPPSYADDRAVDREANAGLPKHLMPSRPTPSKILITRIGLTVRRLVGRL